MRDDLSGDMLALSWLNLVMSFPIIRSIVEDMTNLGFGERFLNELVQGGMRTNYGQGLSMHAFVGE